MFMLSSPTLRAVEIIESLFEKALGLSVQAMKMERSRAELTNRTCVFWDLYNLVNKSFTPVWIFWGKDNEYIIYTRWSNEEGGGGKCSPIIQTHDSQQTFLQSLSSLPQCLVNYICEYRHKYKSRCTIHHETSCDSFSLTCQITLVTA